MSEQRSQRDNPTANNRGAVAKQNLHLGEVTVVPGASMRDCD